MLMNKSSRPLTKSIIAAIIISLSLLRISKATEPIPNFDLSSTSLDPKNTGFTIGPSALTNEFLGQSLGTAGDIDGDGNDDIIIGAYGYDSSRGVVYIIYGGPSSSFTNIDTSSTTLDPLTTGFTLTGNVAGDRFGERVSRAGDIDNDGYDDFIIATPAKEGGRGAVYLIYGGPKSSLSNIDLSSSALNPARGFMIRGENANDEFGWSVNPAGDVNKDDYDDIIIGAPSRSTHQGAAYVIYGGPKSSTSLIDLSSVTLNPTSTGFIIIGYLAEDLFGRWVNTAGDVNNDGYDDMIIGACRYNAGQGASYVIYGKEKSLSSNIHLSTLALDPSTTGFTIIGEIAGDQLGLSVSSAGDINKDGFDDIMIGTNTKDSNKGVVYVIYGAPKSSLPNIDLSSTPLSPAAGFMITGDSGDFLGWPVTPGGDINGDGFPDMIIGGYGHDSQRGAVYVVYGGPKSSLSSFDLGSTALDPLTTGFTLKGSDQFGFSANAGDFNNDGYNDIIIGAPAKNGGSGFAYVIHSGIFFLWFLKYLTIQIVCPADHCSSCLSRTCQACKTPYTLYQSWCLLACPTRTFSSSGFCRDCPIHCSSCISQESCKTCDEGYTLSNSRCISRDSHLKTEIKATQAISNGVRGISSVVNIGSATSPMTALVSKIVQNTRYLNLSVTDELTEIYKTWNTDIISWQVPNAITRLDHYKISPEVFARYGLASSFVENFWATLMTIALSIAILITFYGLKIFLDQAKYDNWLASLAKKLIAGSFNPSPAEYIKIGVNFALVQAYGCFDDILLYLVLDLKTNPFNTFFSWASLFCAIGFLALGCFLVFLNVWKVRQYQRIKTNTTDIEAFNERNKKWELFYSDFNDTDIWTQSALALLVVRSSLSSLIITTLYEYALMQTGFLVILDGAIILFLFFNNPFNTLRGKLAQYYFEAITLLVHLCTLILALQDTFPSSSETLREILSTGIIYLNTALISGSLGFLFIEIYKTISQKIRESKQKNIAIQEDTMEAQRILPCQQTINRIHPEPEIDPHQKSILRNNKRDLQRENSLPGFTQNIHVSFTGLNPQSSNDYNLTMNTDDSMIPDFDSSLRFHPSPSPNIEHQFQSRRILQQKSISLERNPKRQIKNFDNIDPNN